MTRPAIRLATRSSALALLQAGMVAEALGALGRDTTPVVLSSSGDVVADVPIHAIGGRGVFVKEIDQAVIGGAADIAVHSAKDIPSTLDSAVVIAAYLPRADPRDVLVGRTLAGLTAGARVATGSVRRRAQLAWLRPDLTYLDLRGNIATRLGKVPPGGAVVVAKAALDRLGRGDRISQILSPREMLPQVGQGAIALCCKEGDDFLLELLSAIDHAPTRAAVDAERAWLAAVGGGCDLPVGAHCVAEGANLKLEAMIASLDGHVVIRDAEEGRDPADVGARLAERLLERGGRALLAGLNGVGAVAGVGEGGQ